MELRQRIERAALKGNAHLNVDLFLSKVENKQAFILELNKAIIGCEVLEYENERYMLIVFVEGLDVINEMPEFISLTKQLARSLSCSYIEAFGRTGWSKTFKQYNIQLQYSAYRMEV